MSKELKLKERPQKPVYLATYHGSEGWALTEYVNGVAAIEAVKSGATCSKWKILREIDVVVIDYLEEGE